MDWLESLQGLACKLGGLSYITARPGPQTLWPGLNHCKVWPVNVVAKLESLQGVRAANFVAWRESLQGLACKLGCLA